MKKLKWINSYMKNKRIARNIRNKRNICFPGFASSLLKYKSFLSLGLECPIYQNIRIFYGVGFFIFGAREVPSWNIRSFFKKFHFPSFFWENIRTFLILDLESSISRNIRNSFFFTKYREFFSEWTFFIFQRLGWKVRKGALCRNIINIISEKFEWVFVIVNINKICYDAICLWYFFSLSTFWSLIVAFTHNLLFDSNYNRMFLYLKTQSADVIYLVVSSSFIIYKTIFRKSSFIDVWQGPINTPLLKFKTILVKKKMIFLTNFLSLIIKPRPNQIKIHRESIENPKQNPSSL